MYSIIPMILTQINKFKKRIFISLCITAILELLKRLPTPKSTTINKSSINLKFFKH